MQDFRKSVLQSSLWLKDISQDTFSWSAGKHRLFHVCRRAYLIRYYIAQGGWDAGASQIARKAFTEKYLRTFPAWLAEMLADSLAETLLQLKNVPKHKRRGELIHALKLHLSHRIFLADIFLESREYLNDPKKQLREPIALEVLPEDAVVDGLRGEHRVQLPQVLRN